MTNDTSEHYWRASAISGLAGALTMLLGDVLLYAHWGTMPAVSPAIDSLLAGRKAILLATDFDLLLSGLTGPIAAALYLGGAWHVFTRLRQATPRLALLSGGLFALVQVMSGAYHAMWAQYGVILQFANTVPDQTRVLLQRAASTMQFMVDAQSWVVVPLMILLLVQVIRGKSQYPRWSALLNPFLLYGVLVAAFTPLATQLSVPYGGLLLGGLYNALMVIFFAMSLMTLGSTTKRPHASPLRA